MAIALGARGAAMFGILLGSLVGQAQVHYLGGVYVQDFNTLPATGSFSFVGPGPHALPDAPVNATGLVGWSFALVPGSTGADAKFSIGTGSSTAGAVYSYGSTGQVERALGSLASGSVISRFGVTFVNDTPNIITRVTMTYTGEQWRYGGSDNANGLRLSYAIGATDIGNGSFSEVDALSFQSPVVSGGTGALNGNAAANRVAVSGAVSGLAWAPGQTLVIRWTDENENGNDDGLGIDDFSLSTDSGTGPLEVTSTFPLNGASAGFPNSSLTIHFNHPTVVAGAWYQVTGSVSGSHDATVSGPPTSQTIRPTNEFAFGELVSVRLFAAGIVDQNTGLNLPADYTYSFSIVEPPGAITRIHIIQGAGLRSPVEGSFVAIEGVVTGVFQSTARGLHGFFMQELEANYDHDPATSEGIFVFDDGTAPPLLPGDLVTVAGIVAEVDGLTQLAPVASVRVGGKAPLPAPIPLTMPFGALDAPERYEGMLVTFPQTLTVTRNDLLGSDGEVELTSGPPLPQPTNVVAPGAQANALQIQNDLDRLLLDDGNRQRYPDPTPYLQASGTLRAGDTTSGVVGVLTQSDGRYRLEPTATVTFTANNPRSPLPPAVDGRVRVAAANVLNYFNGDGLGGGFPTARGASNPAELARQREKILAGLMALGADVYGLTEVENDGYGTNSAVRDLVNGLNTMAPAGTSFRYIFANFGLGGDLIKCALIYREQTVAPIGLPATTTTAPFNSNRPPLAQTFREIATGEKFSVVVNHFRSKGGTGTGLDADQGDGQGVLNHLRTLQAQVLVEWLATDPTGSEDPDFLIIGDLNSYAKEDPIAKILDAGYRNLAELFEGEGGYSFSYAGQFGHLDHALASPGLKRQVTGTATWHCNADEPAYLDYNLEHKSDTQQALNVGTPFRASDHDPIVIGLNLAPGLTYGAWASGVAWPVGADTSPGGDPDGDGLSNAMEFLLNSDPVTFTSVERPTLAASGSTMAFTYRRRKNAGAVGVEVQTSTDLQVWISAGPGRWVGEADAETDLYVVSLPLGSELGFFRLHLNVQ